MAVRVYSPAAGIRVRLKVEDSRTPRDQWRPSGTTRAGAWET